MKFRKGIYRWVWLAALILWSFAAPCEIHAQSVNLDQAAMKRAHQYEVAILTAAAKYKVDAHLLWTIAYLETRFDPALVSPKGARGLMQFMPATAAAYGLSDPHDPVAAIEAAAKYVRDLSGRYHRADLVLAAYNAGETTVEAYRTSRVIEVGGQTINPKGLRTGGIPPYRETQRYVARGLQLLATLRQANLFMNKKAVRNEAKARTSIVRKSIRAAIPSDEPSRRTIYFFPARADH